MARDEAGVRRQARLEDGSLEEGCQRAVDAFLETVTDSLKNGNDITFTGFGKFSTQNRAARMGVNPRNPSQKVQIPAATVPRFSAGSQLKQAVKSGGSSSY